MLFEESDINVDSKVFSFFKQLLKIQGYLYDSLLYTSQSTQRGLKKGKQLLKNFLRNRGALAMTVYIENLCEICQTEKFFIMLGFVISICIELESKDIVAKKKVKIMDM